MSSELLGGIGRYHSAMWIDIFSILSKMNCSQKQILNFVGIVIVHMLVSEWWPALATMSQAKKWFSGVEKSGAAALNHPK